MKIFIPKPLAFAISAQIALSVGSTQTLAQEEVTELEEVVITGTRRSARSVADSPVPIDVVSGHDFVNQGATDLGTLLRNVVPSYNVNTQPISDAATIVRSAQYGSDAIAGVMNFILKDDAEGVSFEARYGEFSEGDAKSKTLSGNFGLPLTDSGFANFSFEVGSSDPTDRSVQRNDAQRIIDAGKYRSG